MTERLSPPDPHPGVVDRLAAWLFPGLYPVAPADEARAKEGRCFPCTDHDHRAKEPELEAGS